MTMSLKLVKRWMVKSKQYIQEKIGVRWFYGIALILATGAVTKELVNDPEDYWKISP